MKNKILLLLIFSIFSIFMNASFAANKNAATKHYDPESLPENPTILLEGQTSFTAPLEYQKITLKEAIEYASANNLDIKGQRLNIDISAQNIKSAGQFKNPNIESFISTGKAGFSDPNGVGAVLPIDIFKRGARKNLAKANLEFTKDDVSLSEFDLRLKVRKAYVDLAAAKSNLKILEENEKIITELNNLAKKRIKSKKINEMDLIQTEIILNQLEIEKNLAKANVKTARYNFNTILNSKNLDSMEDNLPLDNDFRALLTPKPTEILPDFKTISDVAIKKRLGLKKAEKDIDIAQKNLTLVIRKRVPDIELKSGYAFIPYGKSSNDRLEQGVYFGGQLVNIPVFYQYSPEIKNAKTQVEQKQIAYESLKKKALNNLHSAYDQFTTAQKNLNYYNKKLLPESEEFIQSAKKSYESGKSNLIDFILIQQTYKTILMDYTTVLVNYYDSWINLLREIKG